MVAGCTSESKLGQRNSEAQDGGGALSLSLCVFKLQCAVGERCR